MYRPAFAVLLAFMPRLAQSSMVNGIAGHLATITSLDELGFLEAKFGSSVGIEIWIGGFQPGGNAKPAGGWQWVTGEPFTGTKWRQPAEPNNNGNENRITLFPDMTWNDTGDVDGFSNINRRAYMIEFPIPEPSAFALAATSLIGLSAIRRRQRIAR